MQSTKLSPLLINTLLFASGISLGLNAPSIPINLFTLTAIYTLTLITLVRYKHFGKLLSLGFLLVGILFGSSSHMVSASQISLIALNHKFTSITGRIDSIVSKKVNGRKINQSFILNCETTILGKSNRRKTNGHVQVYGINLGQDFNPGDCVSVKGELRKPQPPLLPGQFDLSGYLARNKIFHTLMLIGKKSVQKRDVCESPVSFQMRIDYLRQLILRQSARIFDPISSALASALIIGYQKDIPKTVREKYVKTGTAHLLAVSGLNITLMVSFFYYAMIQAGIVSATLWNPIFSIICAIFYCFVAGANPPVVRASLMIFLTAFGILTGRDSNLINLLCVSFLLALVANPASIASPSLQLSYLAVLALIIHMPAISKFVFKKLDLYTKQTARQTQVRLAIAFITQNIASTLVTFIWLWPIIAYYFNILSPSSFLGNLIAAPFFLLANILIIGILGISVINLDLAQQLAHLPAWCFSVTNWALDLLTKLPLSSVYLISPTPILIVLYYSGLLLLLVWNQKFYKLAGTILLAGFIGFYGWLCFGKPEPHYTIFSFGREAQCIIQPTHGQTYGVFIRDRQLSESQLDWTLKPFLKSQGINRLNRIWIFSNSYKKDTEWLKKFGQSFHISPGNRNASNDLVSSIYIPRAKRNTRGNLRAGYRVQMDGFTLLHLTHVTRSSDLDALAMLDLEASVVILSNIQNLNDLRLSNILNRAQIVIHQAQIPEIERSLTGSRLISISDYPLIKLWKSKDRIRLELYPPNTKSPLISELPIAG